MKHSDDLTAYFFTRLALMATALFPGCKTSSEAKAKSFLIEVFPVSVKAKIRLSDSYFEVLEDAGFDGEQVTPTNLTQGALDDSVTLAAQYCETKISAGKYDFKVDDREIYIQKNMPVAERFNILHKFEGGSADSQLVGRSLDGRKFFGTFRLDRGQPKGKFIYIALPQISFSGVILSINYDCKIETRS